MRAELTKIFSFSACYSAAGRVLAGNYLFGITVEWLPEPREKELMEIVQREVIRKVRTRDLGDQVDFLKKITIDDRSLLEAFWKCLSVPLSDFGVKSLTLRRDLETSTTIWPGASR
jgi:hypothetical protein